MSSIIIHWRSRGGKTGTVTLNLPSGATVKDADRAKGEWQRKQRGRNTKVVTKVEYKTG